MNTIKEKKLQLRMMVIILMMGALYMSCTKQIDSVKINTQFDCGTTFPIGATVLFQATILPDGANSNLVWSSSNSAVASITKNGLMVAVGVGNATIICKTENGKYSDDIDISVVEDNAVKVTGIYTGTVTMDSETIPDILLSIVATSIPDNLVSISIEQLFINGTAVVSLENEIYQITGEGVLKNETPLTVQGSINQENTAYFTFNDASEPPKTIVFTGQKAILE
jgi:hypothetical protein